MGGYPDLYNHLLNGMKTIALILLSLLAVWLCLLTVWVISCHRQRVRLAAKTMTPQELEECRQLEASFPRYHMRLKDWAVTSPFWLPLHAGDAPGLPLFLARQRPV